MMKLFAFRDRHQDADKDFARHHAMDLYRVVAMTSHAEFQETRAALIAHWPDAVVQEAKRIVADEFSSPTSIGMIRFREHSLFEPEMGVNEFQEALADLFAER